MREARIAGLFIFVTIFVIFQVVAVLAALIRTSHILVYAPSASFLCRLATPRTI